LKRDLGHQVDSFSPAAIGVLTQKTWPGRARALRTRAHDRHLSPTRVIEPEDLWPRRREEARQRPWHLGYRELRKRVLLRFESDFVARMLKAAGGNVSLAARLAKIDRKHPLASHPAHRHPVDRFDK